MNKFNKRVLSVLLCLTMLCALFIPLSVNAENDETTAKNNLIAAWEALAADTKVEKVVIATPKASTDDADGNPKTRTEVTAQTTVAGLTDASVLGTYYVDKIKFTKGTSTSARDWNYIVSFQTVDSSLKLKDYNSIYFYAASFNGSNYCSVNMTLQINNGSTLTAYPYTNSGSWRKITLNPTSDNIGTGFKFLVNGGSTLTHVSFGSIIGEKNIAGPALPTGYADMSLYELVTAADAVEYEGYSASQDFINALNAAKEFIDDEVIAFHELVSAWQTLSADTKLVKDVLAVPKTSTNDADGTAKARTEVTSTTTVDGLSDTSVLGPYYVDKLKFSKGDTNTSRGWNFAVNFTIQKTNFNLKDYSAIYLYAASFNGTAKNSVGFSIQYNNDSGSVSYPWTQASGWTKLSVRLNKDLNVSTIKLLVNNNQTITHVSYGSIIGERSVTGPALPTGYENMSLLELVSEAKAVDATGFSSADAFNTALANAISAIDPEVYAVSELVAAWNAITSEEKIGKQVIAVPKATTNDADGTPKARTEVTAQTLVAGIDDVSVLGTYYVDKIKFTKGDSTTSRGWNYTVSFSTVDSSVKLKDFDSIYFYAASFNGADYCSVNMTLQINNGDTLNTYPFTNGGSWRKITLSPTKDAIGSGIKFLVNDGMTLTHMSFGSVIGEKVVNGAPLPTNHQSMSLTQLVAAAKAIDYKGFASSDRFEAALANAEAYVDVSPELREKLDTAWKNIGIRYYEEIAVPKETMLGGNGETFERTEITDQTTIEGLSDKTLLGSYYVDKLSVSTANSSASLGWDYIINFKTLKSDIELLKYDSVYFYANAYNGNSPVSARITTQINNGSNATNYSSTYGGWTKISMVPTSDVIGSGFKFAVEPNQTVTSVSFGSVFGSYVVKPAYPENADELSFIEFVEAAENCDMTGYDTTEFDAILDECKALIESRKTAVKDALTAASQTLPENVDSLTASELVSAAKEYNVDDAQLSRAVWMLNLLTDEGPVIDALANAWNAIDVLPEDYRMLTAEEWLTLSNNFDISNAEDEAKDAFNKALDALKNFLTKGKSDISILSELVTKANTMNYYDFTGDSWTDFGKALTKANAVLNDYAKVTQNKVDAASDELLAAWGKLKMFVRTQWFDYMEYFLQTDPQMKVSYTGKDTETSVIVEKVSVPNGANAAIVVTNQKSGWSNVVNASGVDLTSISNQEILELWFKADKDNNTMSQMTIQFMTSNGLNYYTAEIVLPKEARSGEWYRLEVPITAFKSIDYRSNLTADSAFVANQVRLVSNVGVGSYSLANFAVVTTEDVEAGVVPNVPKMKINERKEIVYEPPKNPFTGLDRGDPWGWEEKKKNPLKDKVTEEEIEDTNTNSSDENAEPVIVVEGECGDSVTWKFYSDGKLVIEGTGKMSDFPEIAPWIEENCDVLSVSISDGITSIGDSAFYGCSSLTEIAIPDSVTRIGMFAFYECDNLKFAKVSSNVKEVGAYAFGFVYDAETATAKLVDGFKLSVEEPSEALTYAKTYEVPYEIYKSNKKADTTPVATENNMWIWILVGAAAVVFIAGAVVSVVVVKKRKNALKGVK